MINIFHGDNTTQSYLAFSELVDSHQSSEKYRQSGKNIDPDSLDRFLNTSSLFSETKVVILENLFSQLKPQLDKIIKLINLHPDFDYFVWQDKKVEAAKLKSFPKSDIKLFSLPEILFSCLNSISPHHQKEFLQKYQILLQSMPFELALFWFKNTLRRQLTTYSKFSTENLKRAYLSLIKLDYQSKTGTLFEPKDIALERNILSLIDSQP